MGILQLMNKTKTFLSEILSEKAHARQQIRASRQVY